MYICMYVCMYNNNNNKRSLLVQLKETIHAYKNQKDKTDNRGSPLTTI